jgi:hypothetical protein
MKRQIVVVTALWTVLCAQACGSDEAPSAEPASGDAGNSSPGQKTQPQSRSDAGARPAAEGGGADGQACSADDDCDNSHCVMGICCKQACTDPGEECRDVEAATCEGGQACKYPVAADGTTCDDADACTVGNVCKGGECQPSDAQRDCDDKNPCTDDKCDAKVGCVNQNNDKACDDNNACTEADQCRGGECRGTSEKDCSGDGDACNKGVCDPKDGSCTLQAAADGANCDAADSCSKAGACKAGTCVGENACGPNATTCTVGTPNACTCKQGFQASEGQCVPESDECSSNPCGANADCFDPSNTAGDVTCSCKPGFSGDAKQGCSACGAGMRTVGGQCVCDMQGTFALRFASVVSWKGVNGIEDGRGEGNSWMIVRQNYTDNGDLALELIGCGETNLDLCGTGVQIAGISREAYSQYIPVAVRGKAGSPTTRLEFNLPAPVPGSAYKTPRHALLNGIALEDPLGAWPASRKEVMGSGDFAGSATNGARWLDSDQDSLFGQTTYAVGPNGETPAGELAPIAPYPMVSAACPRGDAAAARLPYNYPPGLDGLTARRIKRFSSASRSISELDGTLTSCDEINGNVTGPDNGRAQLNSRIGSCIRVDSNSGEVACSSSLLDFLDNSQAPSAFESQTFKMKRVDANTTCEQVRALPF